MKSDHPFVVADALDDAGNDYTVAGWSEGDIRYFVVHGTEDPEAIKLVSELYRERWPGAIRLRDPSGRLYARHKAWMQEAAARNQLYVRTPDEAPGWEES
jgi:hypothetical protein